MTPHERLQKILELVIDKAGRLDCDKPDRYKLQCCDELREGFNRNRFDDWCLPCLIGELEGAKIASGDILKAARAVVESQIDPGCSNFYARVERNKIKALKALMEKE